MQDLRSDAERRYDATRLSRTPIADEPQYRELIAVLEKIEPHLHLEDTQPSADYEQGFHDGRQSVRAEIDAILNGAEPLPMRKQFEIIWAADEMPNGAQIYAMLLEDHIAHFLWWRCVDWVLYRQRNGMPVKRANSSDDCPAEINACFLGSQRTYARPGSWPAAVDGREVCLANTMDEWDRTPEQERALREETETFIAILEAVDGGE